MAAPTKPNPLDTILHIRVSEDERRSMAVRALADHRPLTQWCRVQLLRAFEPRIDASDEGPSVGALEKP